MRAALWAGWMCVAVAGCSRPAAETTTPVSPSPPTTVTRDRPEGPVILSSLTGPSTPAANEPVAPPSRQPEASQSPTPGFVHKAWRQEQRSSVRAGLEWLAARHWSRALEQFQVARDLHSSDWLHTLIERLKVLIGREAEAELVARDIQIVLEAGRPAEASRLASEALRGFSHLRTADRLAVLKRQADALLLLQSPPEQRQQHLERMKDEYNQAVAEQNLRAAWLAVDDLLAWTDEPEWRSKHETTTEQFRRYEKLRHAALTVWRNEDRLSEAIALFEEAASLWPNPEILAELNDARLARRRLQDEFLAVADLMVVDRVVPPEVGSLLSEELALALHRRLQVLNRADFQRHLDEANLPDDAWHDETQRRKLIEAIPQLRYLVFGAVTPWAGTTLKVQTVDLWTGLVVQTGQVSAATWREVLAKFDDLAESMSQTENYLASDRTAGETVVEQASGGPLDDLPPLLERLGQAPKRRDPLVPARLRGPSWGVMTPAEVVQRLEQWPSTVSGGSETPPSTENAEPSPELRRRAARVAVELGDDFLGRGHFLSARRQYDAALTLWPQAKPIRERWELSQILVPDPGQAPGGRKRVILIPFATAANSRSEATPLGRWVADFFGCYLGPEWDIVHTEELSYWMGRLGLTISDLLTDSASRACLAQALQARYYLWGSVVRRNQIDVRTYLMDAMTGEFVAGSRIAGRDTTEVKNRLAELAWMLTLSPDERRRAEMTNGQWAWLRMEIEQSRDRDRDMDRVLRLAETGLKLRPHSVEMRLTWWTTKTVRDHSQMEYQRLTDEERFEKLSERSRQWQVAAARRSEEARRKAERETRRHNPPQTLAERELWPRAAKERRRQAAAAARAGRDLSAVGLLESAVALTPDDAETLREWAQARAALEIARIQQIEGEQKQRSVERQRRDQARQQERFARIDEEWKPILAAATSRQNQMTQEDRRHANQWLNRARQEAEQKRYADAIRAAGIAQLHHPADEIDTLRRQWIRDYNTSLSKQPPSTGSPSSPDDPSTTSAAFDQRLTRIRQDLESRLDQGEDLLRQGRWTEAEAAFLKAESIQPTARGFSGQRQARRRIRLEAEAAAAKAHAAEEQQRREQAFRQCVEDAEKARSAGDEELAATLYQQALQHQPGDADCWLAWGQADLRRWQARLRKYGEEQDRYDAEAFRALLSSAKAYSQSGKWFAAAVTVERALGLRPGDPEA
ncbi:MAG: hypothetical protein N2039_01755, partial [Gemmataceae bacterium]|nr:hypothetical protein [Gemmataceae bacterium]